MTGDYVGVLKGTQKRRSTKRENGERLGKNPDYTAQYKFLSKRSQLRVWVEKEKYERLKKAVEKRGTSIYKLINEFVDSYLEDFDD